MGLEKKVDDETEESEGYDEDLFQDGQRLIQKSSELVEESEEDIRSSVDEYVDRYNGLVNLAGATTLYFRDEHDIELTDEFGIEKAAEEDTTIDFLVSNCIDHPSLAYGHDLELEIADVPPIKNGDGWKLRNVVVTDGTETVKLNLWNEFAEAAGDFEAGDKIEVEEAYIDEYNGNPQLKIPKRGCMVLPSGKKIEGPDYDG